MTPEKIHLTLQLMQRGLLAVQQDAQAAAQELQAMLPQPAQQPTQPQQEEKSDGQLL